LVLRSSTFPYPAIEPDKQYDNMDIPYVCIWVWGIYGLYRSQLYVRLLSHSRPSHELTDRAIVVVLGRCSGPDTRPGECPWGRTNMTEPSRASSQKELGP